MKLIIVESPTKAKTIGKFLGKGYELLSSFGHIRDLPKSKIGVDLENDFEPKYMIPAKARETVKKLKKEAGKADAVVLATDEDREGEAIAWHLAAALGLDAEKTERIVFHEITERAIQEALKSPRRIDMSLVDAQQARRILDRIVGYKLSPFLWQKVARGLSAGRVQSVTLRLIVDREREIRAFVPTRYFSVVAELTKKTDPAATCLAELFSAYGKQVDRLELQDEAAAKKIVDDIKVATVRVKEITQKEVKRHPSPPFTTSTLTQTAANKLGYAAKKTMFAAQKLYENGWITYMRTDSVNIASEALSMAKEYLEKELGAEYAADAPRRFATKSKGAQEAHEAIRPTHLNRSAADIEALEPSMRKVYDLISKRFLASQMPPARFNQMTILFEAGPHILKTTGSQMLFPGFLKVYPSKTEDVILPTLEEKEEMDVKEVKYEEHFTEPAARYSEATLIKALEENGVGRPSTYAPTISTIEARGYVEKIERRFHPTEIGEKVTTLLEEHFPTIVDVGFTAGMEEGLDDVAEKKIAWKKLLKDFYDPFAKNLAEKYESVARAERPEPIETNEICDKCGKKMVVRAGRYGKFLACSGFPECKNAKKITGEVKTESGAVIEPEADNRSTGVKCDKCGEGEMMKRFTKKGRRLFFGCSRYPQCDNATWTDPRKAADKKD
ncbi:MAG: type I DNA topoisomerase [Candidatus Harrisonbacteria bacterium]|nr:type I DNA topoisomerase [Candidatus Harrisonbacteria bacterium]